jgi:cell division protein ZapE
MVSGSGSVSARLAAEVAAGRLQFDPLQQAAALRLDSLAAKLRTSPRTRRLVPWRPPAPHPARGLYLWGGVGRGKTLLMDLFVESLRDAPTLARGSAERTHFYHFMRDVHAALAAIHDHARPLELVAERVARRIRVLCLDEFFVADIADAMLLAGLLDGLFHRGVTLVTTSNLAPEDLYKQGLQRQRFVPAIALIRAHVEVIHLDGGIDYRLRELRQTPTYLDSTRPGSAEAMLARFTALTGGNSAAPCLLSVEGRPIRAERAVGGTAWFEFSGLCDGPRSQNDYIELARRHHTLFIAHVPLFDSSTDDAARRFIMLIDELYDRGVKIVVSAAAAPTQLYRGERLQFEFERAASRLTEMQSEEYLATPHRP